MSEWEHMARRSMRGPGEAASMGADQGVTKPLHTARASPGHLQHPQIPLEHFSPIHCFPEHPDEGKRGVKAGAARDLLIPGEISPLLTLGWGRMSGRLKAASPPILGTRICDRGGRGVSQGGKAGIATRDIYFFPKPRCETSAPSPELLGPQHITGDSFAELLSSRLSS